MNSKKLTHEAGHIVFVHPSLMGGGAERVSLALASYFVTHGIRFTYLLTKSNVVEYDVPEGVEVRSEFASATLKPFDQVKLIRRFISERPNATVISFLPHQNMYTLIATIGLPNRVIVSVRNDPRYDFPGNKILPFIRNMLYRRSDAIVFQTKSQASLMPRYLQANSKIILNPISSELPEPYSGLRRKAIVTSGRLELQKNHSMTIRSFTLFHKKHPEYTLEIFGKGSLQSELESLVHSLDMDDSIKFMGFSSDALMHIRTASAFVMSSKFEGLSNSMLESLCMGVPTICTKCGGGGAEAVIRNGENGILVDIDDDLAESEAFNKIVEDKSYSNHLSNNALMLRQSLSLETIGNEWANLLFK